LAMAIGARAFTTAAWRVPIALNITWRSRPVPRRPARIRPMTELTEIANPEVVGYPDAPLVEIRGLTKQFVAGGTLVDRLLHRPLRVVTAVDDVDLEIQRGEVLALVGESGCGKSTLSRCLLRLIEPTAGEVRFDGVNIVTLDPEALRRLRPKMQIIFQDPFASLNPRLTVGQALGEVLAVHRICRKEEIPTRVDELLRMVGLPVTVKDRFPRSFSGGQQQRVGIARALAASPSLLVADEAVSKLDVSVQVQILNLLRQLQRDLGLTILIVAHDLAVVRYVSQRVAVMYLGAIVEFATTEELFSQPSHPYTRALLSAVPKLQAGTRQRTASLQGDPPSPLSLPSGCRFHTRCPRAESICSHVPPPLREIAPGHLAACHFADELLHAGPPPSIGVSS
jgi:oligopeptide transport system ATP-binding protein